MNRSGIVGNVNGAVTVIDKNSDTLMVQFLLGSSLHSNNNILPLFSSTPHAGFDRL